MESEYNRVESSSSVEISKTAKGEMTFTVKIYNDDSILGAEQAFNTITKIHELADKYWR